MTTISLKPTNTPLVTGCPGVPKTFPHVSGTLEIRNNGEQMYLSHIVIKLVTIDTLKFNKQGVPAQQNKLNYEVSKKVGQSLLGLDLPFEIPIGTNVGPTVETCNYTTTHSLKVEVHYQSGGRQQAKIADFPVLITKYDNLPIYRQFNEPLNKIVDSKDTLFMCDYSLPCSSIGPDEELQLNLKISKTYKDKKLRLKKVFVDIIETFECRSETPFIKEFTISSQQFDINQDVESDFSKQFQLKLQSIANPYKLFHKHQDAKLLNKPYTTSHKPDLKPIIIDHNSYQPIPFIQHNTQQTFKSHYFQVYYQLKITIKYNKFNKDLVILQPFTISNFNRIESIKLIKWILALNEEISDEDYEYDSRFDVFKRRQWKEMRVMRNREDRDRFV